MLAVEGLEVSYGLLRAVRGLSFAAAAGEVVALVGANGAGKSSTLKGLVGLAPATAGTITLDGRPIAKLPPFARIAAGIALSPEGRHVFPDMSVAENLAAGAGDVGRTETAARAEAMFALFPRLAERRRQLAGTMSGGEQQMVAIARALMSKPKVLLLDEPTLGLAPIIVRQIADLVRRLRDEGLAVVLAEQNVQMALAVSDRAYVLERGALAQSGASRTLAADPAIQSAYLGL